MNDGRADVVDQRVGESLLFIRNFVAPIRSPMDRNQNHVVRLAHAGDLCADSLDAGRRKIAQEIDAWQVAGRGPVVLIPK